MLYETLFALLAFAGIGGVVVLFLLFFLISYLINRRLDSLAKTSANRFDVDHTPQHHPAQERLFWKISKYVIQGVIFIDTGFLVVALAGFTPVPVYILWLLFFVAWGGFFLHKFRSFSLPQNQFIQLQNIFEEEDDFAIDDDINLGAPSRKHHTFREKIQHYIFTCKLAVRNKKVLFFVSIAVIFIATGIIVFSSSCMCVVIHPFEINTALSRKLFKQYCVSGDICNIYFTVGSQPNEFIMNFQMSDRPEQSFVYYATESHYNTSRPDWLTAYPWFVSASNFKMTTIDEFERYVSWADIPHLQPNTTYYFVAAYKNGANMIASKEYKLRTIPASGPFSFVTGGDMSLDSSCHELMDIAASKDPYFAMIGGDITYDNGFASCYYRWDQWFDQWEKRMVTKDGYYIPIIASIGNHEAGGFLSGYGNDPYYSAYFPQQTGISYIPPRSRKTYHSHQITKDAFIVVLDTDIIERMDGNQSVWLGDQLKAAVETPAKFALYHGNIYPAVPDAGSATLQQRGKEFWVPLFDKYNVTSAFENHCHAYKRTKPLRADKVSEDNEGVVYLGDGAWGVDPRPPAESWYTQFVAQTQHVFHVSVGRDEEDVVTVEAINRDGHIFDQLYRFVPIGGSEIPPERRLRINSNN